MLWLGIQSKLLQLFSNDPFNLLPSAKHLSLLWVLSTWMRSRYCLVNQPIVVDCNLSHWRSFSAFQNEWPLPLAMLSMSADQCSGHVHNNVAGGACGGRGREGSLLLSCLLSLWEGFKNESSAHLGIPTHPLQPITRERSKTSSGFLLVLQQA